MKGILIIILILGVLAIGYLYFKGQMPSYQPAMQSQPTQGAAATSIAPVSSSVSSESSAATSASSSVAAGAKVDYNGGFTPKTITIKSGETVTWTNNDSNPMWVASNPHPVHTDYPGFDALKEIPHGGTYSFTFTKAGTWGYHNHLNPSQGGTVIVQP